MKCEKVLRMVPDRSAKVSSYFSKRKFYHIMGKFHYGTEIFLCETVTCQEGTWNPQATQTMCSY